MFPALFGRLMRRYGEASIRDVFGGTLALNCWVIRPGSVRIDDPVRIVPAPSDPDRKGGWIVGATVPAPPTLSSVTIG